MGSGSAGFLCIAGIRSIISAILWIWYIYDVIFLYRWSDFHGQLLIWAIVLTVIDACLDGIYFFSRSG